MKGGDAKAKDRGEARARARGGAALRGAARVARGAERAARTRGRGARARRRDARRHLRGRRATRRSAASSEARAIVRGELGGSCEGEAPARRWLAHRYAVSYRQAPVFADGAFVDTMEVAAPLVEARRPLRRRPPGARRARLRDGPLQPRVPRRLLHLLLVRGERGAAAARGARARGWDAALRGDLRPRVAARARRRRSRRAGRIAHHHGVGRSKAPRLARRARARASTSCARSMRAFDPRGIMNPGNLVPPGERRGRVRHRRARRSQAPVAAAMTPRGVDRESLLASIERHGASAAPSARLARDGLTLSLDGRRRARRRSRRGSRAALRARATAGSIRPTSSSPASMPRSPTARWSIRPAPRRAVGPDLSALFVGAGGRFGRIDRAWMRVHRRDATRPTAPRFDVDRDPPCPTASARCSTGSRALFDRRVGAFARRRRLGARGRPGPPEGPQAMLRMPAVRTPQPAAALRSANVGLFGEPHRRVVYGDGPSSPTP